MLPEIFSECYPEGVPDTFPAALFAPVAAGACVIREGALQERIEELEEAMLPLPQEDMTPTNYFADGVYVRSLFMRKGTVFIGRVHLRECVNILVKGDLTLLTVDGPVRLVAPQIFVSAPGTKKVVFINEDALFTTTHSLPPTEDEASILSALSVPSFKHYAALLAAHTQEVLS